jgi:AraC-like DNA-binding protein
VLPGSEQTIIVAKTRVTGRVNESGESYETCCLVWVREGFYRETSLGKVVDRYAGSFHFHPARLPNDTALNGPVECFGALIPSALMDWMPAQELVDPRANLVDARLQDAGRRLHEEFETDDPLASVAVQSIVTDALTTMYRVNTGPRETSIPAWLRRAREMALDGAGTSLVEIAKEVCVHPSHLSRSYGAAFGESISQTLRNHRFQRALVLLSAGREPIADVATTTGYADQAHLTRDVRSRTGRTPLEIRRTN